MNVRLVVHVALLVVLWLLAWGDISVANLVSGIAVAAVLLVAFPVRERSRARVRPYGAVLLLGYVLKQLVISNVVMTREILRRHIDARPGVIRHHLRHPSEEVIAVMTTIITLSPGTMTADVDMDADTIAVHFFRMRDVAKAHAEMERLERFVVRAITTPASRPAPSPRAGAGFTVPSSKEHP